MICGLGWLFSFSFFCFRYFLQFRFFFWNATAYFAQLAIRGYAPGEFGTEGWCAYGDGGDPNRVTASPPPNDKERSR